MVPPLQQIVELFALSANTVRRWLSGNFSATWAGAPGKNPSGCGWEYVFRDS
jgi:hypothetical protein